MNIAVLGTGMVGRALAAKLARSATTSSSHRDVDATLARTAPGAMGTEPFATWQQTHPEIGLRTFPEAGAHADVILNAVAGIESMTALHAVGADTMAGRSCWTWDSPRFVQRDAAHAHCREHGQSR